ncbi:hypothetical protein P7K49_008994, partial [Saguinus oedipus]
ADVMVGAPTKSSCAPGGHIEGQEEREDPGGQLLQHDAHHPTASTRTAAIPL